MELVVTLLFIIPTLFISLKLIKKLYRLIYLSARVTYDYRQEIATGAGFVGRMIGKLVKLSGNAGKKAGHYAAITAKFAGVGKLDLNAEKDRELLRQLIDLNQHDPRYQDETHPLIIKLHSMERALGEYEYNQGAKNVLSYPLPEIIHALTLKLDNIKEKDLLTQCHGDLLQIAVAVQSGCEENGLVTPQAGRNVADYIEEVDATETVIDLYTQKISRVRKDPNLCEEEKLTKITYLQRLLANQMGRLENA